MGTPRLDTCVPVPIDQEELETLVDKAKDWAIMHGESHVDIICFNLSSSFFFHSSVFFSSDSRCLHATYGWV